MESRIVLVALVGAFFFAKIAEARLEGMQEARNEKRDEEKRQPPVAQAA